MVFSISAHDELTQIDNIFGMVKATSQLSLPILCLQKWHQWLQIT